MISVQNELRRKELSNLLCKRWFGNFCYLRDSRPLIGWKRRHSTLPSLIGGTPVGFEQWKYYFHFKKAEYDQINRLCYIYLIYRKSLNFHFLSHKGVKSKFPVNPSLEMSFKASLKGNAAWILMDTFCTTTQQHIVAMKTARSYR